MDLSIMHSGDFITNTHNFQGTEMLTSESGKTSIKLCTAKQVALMKEGDDQLQETGIHLPHLQHQLNRWMICEAVNRQCFAEAGAKGLNIFIHQMLHTKEELEGNIRLYRKARAAHGFSPETGIVTLMLHTFVGESEEVVISTVKEPFTNYLESSLQLWDQMDEVDEYKRKKLLDLTFEKYYHSSALFGTPTQVSDKVVEFESTGVNEIACLIDFGLSLDNVSENLQSLCRTFNTKQTVMF